MEDKMTGECREVGDCKDWEKLEVCKNIGT